MLLLISLMFFRGHKQNRGWCISLHESDCCSPFSNPWSMSPGSGKDQWLCSYQFVFTPCLGNWFCSWGFLMCSIYSRGDSGVGIQPQSSLRLCLQASFWNPCHLFGVWISWGKEWLLRRRVQEAGAGSLGKKTAGGRSGNTWSPWNGHRLVCLFSCSAAQKKTSSRWWHVGRKGSNMKKVIVGVRHRVTS